MEELLLWLLAAYGCSSFLVLLADKWARSMKRDAEIPQQHYKVLVRDSEQVLERVIRRLLFRSYWSGKPIRISLIDAGSSDHTRRMVSIYERYPYFFRLLEEGQEEQNQSDIVIDLRQESST